MRILSVGDTVYVMYSDRSVATGVISRLFEEGGETRYFLNGDNTHSWRSSELHTTIYDLAVYMNLDTKIQLKKLH